MTSASDHGATADRSARESVIRDLYAIAAFYVAHPDYPLPSGIQVHAAAPLAEIERVAADYSDRGVYGDVPQTHHDLAGTAVPVTMIVGLPREDRPL